MYLKKVFTTLGIALALGITTHTAWAQPLLDGVHADIDVEYNNGFEFHIHDDDNDTEYEPDAITLFVNDGLRLTMPPGLPQFEFIGAQAGDPVWIIPQSQNPAYLWLGFGAEEIANPTFQGGEIKIEMASFSGPGHFALWQNDPMGNPLIKFATFGDYGQLNHTVLHEGGHDHYEWSFTQMGYYDIAFRASGTLLSGEFVQSDPVNFRFLVAEPVPEPATMAALGLGAIALLRKKRRK